MGEDCIGDGFKNSDLDTRILKMRSCLQCNDGDKVKKLEKMDEKLVSSETIVLPTAL